jgi:plasmid stabilization system protein ParE
MPQGDKSQYTDKQKRQAEHIAEGYEERGTPEDEAERIAWATVNKQDGGGKQSGSGRKRSTTSSGGKSGQTGAEAATNKAKRSAKTPTVKKSVAKKPAAKKSAAKTKGARKTSRSS